MARDFILTTRMPAEVVVAVKVLRYNLISRFIVNHYKYGTLAAIILEAFKKSYIEKIRATPFLPVWIPDLQHINLRAGYTFLTIF